MRRVQNIIISSLFVLSVLVPFSAQATIKSLAGEIEYRYADFTSDRSDLPDIDASHFTQRYSFLYTLEGSVFHRRAGFYSLGLGAQWYDLSAEINDKDFDISKAKLLYNGEILVAPGGLPFRLHMYSRDLHSTSFLTNPDLDDGDTVLNPDILTDVRNGTHQVIGGSLMVGIRNGSYMGRYREMLSQYPRLLVDYRQETVRDLESDSPQHYRSRDLAFVSLNKKDNWFHYRYNDYKDYEDSTEDYDEKVYMLGTVDHKLIRQWINLTNWIKVSVDGSYTESTALSRSTADPRETFAINMYSKAHRNGLDVLNFTNFVRETKGDSLRKDLEIPVYLHYDINPDTKLSVQFTVARDEDRTIFFNDQSTTRNSDVIYVDSLLETNRMQRIRIDPRLTVEYKGGNEGRGVSWRAGAEAYTNRLHRSRLMWFGGYDAANFNGTSDSDSDVSYWEQELRGGLSKTLKRGLTVGLTEQLQYGTGDYDGSVVRRLTARTSDSLREVKSNGVNTGDVFRSTTVAYLETVHFGRLSNRLELTYDFVDINGVGNSDKWELTHRLNYTDRKWRINSRSRFKYGETVDGDSGFSSNELRTSAQSADGENAMDHYTRINYSPKRHYDASLNWDYNWKEGGHGEDASYFRADQEFKYSFFKVNGVIRKYASLGERVEYEYFEDGGSDSRQFAKFSLVGSWYPSRISFLRARAIYRLYDAADKDETWEYALSAGYNWPKLTLHFDYSYGYGDYANGSDVTDHRWEVIVKKIF